MVNADFLNDGSLASPLMELDDKTGPKRFFNRELSWLAFNRRVLEVAEDDQIPLLERVRMLSISAKNLDEFLVVRVAGLERLKRAGNHNPTLDGRTPEQQLDQMAVVIDAMMQSQQTCWTTLQTAMAEAGISRVQPADLSDTERAWLEQKYLDNVLPLLRPVRIDPNHPSRSFPMPR